MKLSDDILSSLADILGARHERRGDESVLYIYAGRENPAIVLTLTSLGSASVVVSAQTVHGYFELHNVLRFVPVDPDEVIFVAEEGERISGLVVGKAGTCSLFANVDRSVLSADLSTIEPALLLAAMQLGLAENIPA